LRVTNEHITLHYSGEVENIYTILWQYN